MYKSILKEFNAFLIQKESGNANRKPEKQNVRVQNVRRRLQRMTVGNDRYRHWCGWLDR